MSGAYGWMWFLLFVAAFVWLAYVVITPAPTSAIPIPYTTFLEQVRSENVVEVTIAGQKIEGIFKNPVAEPGSRETAPEADSNGTAAQPEPQEAVTFRNFTTVAPSQDDSRLIPLLEEHGVVIEAKDTSEGSSWLGTLAFTLLPVILLIGFLYFFMSRASQTGQQDVFGFARSRARVYNYERPSITFADVAGIDEAKYELQEVVDFLKSPGKYRALGARLPRGVLLVGPPGTGKTLLAKAVAGEARVPFFSISASEFVEMFVGVGAGRVRDLFQKARDAAPAIVFVDELDAVGRQRGAGLGGGHDEREQTLNQLLTEMDGFDEKTNVIVLAATNRPDVLDPALLRPGRFDRHVTVPLPDREGRKAILRVHTRKLQTGADVDLDALARQTPGFSGADLANLANEAALFAARRNGTEIGMLDFDEAMDKMILGTRQAKVMSDDERRLIAYHEAGHAVVAKLIPGSDPVSKVTIIPHGRALGVTQQLPEEERHTYTLDYLLGRIAGMLGGRTAELIIFGQPTTGAESDLKQATDLARRIVGLWGMTEDLGPVSYGVEETHPFLGRDIGQPRKYAEATAAEIDIAVRSLIEQAQQRAHHILENHRDALDKLAQALIIHETVDKSQIDAVLAAASPA